MAIMEELETTPSSLYEDNLELRHFMTKQTQQTTLMFKAKNYKNERKNFINKATQNMTMTSIPLSISNETKIF